MNFIMFDFKRIEKPSEVIFWLFERSSSLMLVVIFLASYIFKRDMNSKLWLNSLGESSFINNSILNRVFSSIFLKFGWLNTLKKEASN